MKLISMKSKGQDLQVKNENTVQFIPLYMPLSASDHLSWTQSPGNERSKATSGFTFILQALEGIEERQRR